MREIKFRVWDKKYKTMASPDRKGMIGYVNFDIDIDGLITREILNLHLSDVDRTTTEVQKNYVIQQFTGLTDKNNKEIYEGDIVKITLSDFRHPLPTPECDDEYAPKVENTCEVRFRTHEGWIGLVRKGKYKGKSLRLKKNHDEVIGNIFENPELLK